MKIQLMLALCLFYTAGILAQTENFYSVKMGEIPGKVIPNEVKYLMPAFRPGTVLFKDGSTSRQRFNYNSLLDEMHFINEKGDTLAIAATELINYVEIDSIKFYYDSGYVRQIFIQANYKLAVKQRWQQIPDKKAGGYDMGSSIASIRTYSSMSNSNGTIGRLQVHEDVLYKMENSFYIGDKFNHFRKANKKGFYAFFANKKIAQYMEAHKINFNKQEDLEALLQFCVE